MASRLGHGIGLRAEHYADVLVHGVRGVDFVEVISENFFEPGGRPWAVLERARRDVPVVLHGVSMAVGNAGAVPGAYLARLAAVIDRIEPALVSDHLCWGGLGGHFAHDLLPLPYTEEALAHVVENVSRVQERLGRRILLENPSSYVTFRESVIPEWEFLVAVARRAGCAILLDVNNVHVSARNHGFCAERYVDFVPAELVAQVHLAGHTDRGTYLLDSHVGPVPEPVWRLYERLVARTGHVPALVEWDERVPPLEIVAAEAREAARREQEVRRAA